MKIRLYFFLSFLTFTLGNPAFAEARNLQGDFLEANTAYREGDYGRAAALYKSLIKRGWVYADVYYNLGNADFKQDRLGQAILHYERARRLKPRDRDISRNLTYATGLIEYRVEDKRNWYVKTGQAILQNFTSREIALISLGLGVLLGLSWAFFLYLRPSAPWGGWRKLLLLFTLFFLGLWVMKGTFDAMVEEAVVLAPKAAVRYGPSHKDQVAFQLAEGIKVRVKKRANEWARVVLSNGETGWMDEEEIGII